MGLECEWRHAPKRWAGNFDDFGKKAVSWDLNLGEGSPAEGFGICSTFVGSAGELTEGRWTM